MEQNDAVLGAESSGQSKQASICSSFSGITFIQLWLMSSFDEQQEWLRAMHRNIHLLQVQPGYRSMSLNPSLDGRNVIVYAQWDSKEALIAAVERPEVKAARNELDSHGEPEGTIYAIDSVHRSGESSDQAMPIEAGSTVITFVNIWRVEDRDKQQQLLSAIRGDVAKIISKPGARGLVLHSSVDGKRVAVYAQWDSLEDFTEGIVNDPAAQANRSKLAQLGVPQANTYSVAFVKNGRFLKHADHAQQSMPGESQGG